jgi:hypothetical protein
LTFTVEKLKEEVQLLVRFCIDLTLKYEKDAVNISLEDSQSIIHKTTEITSKVIDYFNKSILDGSYLIDSNYSEKVGLFEKEIESSVNYINNEFFSYKSLNPIIVTDILNICKDIISSMIRFIENVKLKLNFQVKRIFINESLFNKFLRLKFKDVDPKVNLFYANLFVAQCDHFVSNSDDKSLRKLDEIIEFLVNLDSTDDIYDKIIAKAHFLRQKITLRIVEEIRSSDNSLQIYVSKNGKNVPFEPEDILTENYLSNFKFWNEYLLTHYQIFNNWSFKLSKSIKSSNDLSVLSVLDLHQLIKYAKDIANNRELIIKVKEELKKRYLNAKSEPEIFSFKVCLSYCYNNEFSLIVQTEKPNTVEILKLYNEIFNSPELSEIKNYFTPALLLSHYVSRLSLFFDKHKVLDNLKECNDILSHADELVTLYQNGINWVKSNYNYIFQLPLNECLIKFNNNNSDLFVYSTCFLPISRDSLHLRFKADLDKLRVFKSSIENITIIKSIDNKVVDLETKFETTKKEFRGIETNFVKNETKTIEIIVLVSAILTFVAGSIPGFKFIDTGKEAVFFSLSLGTSLAFFALLFFVFNRKVLKEEYFVKGIFAAALFVILSWIFLYNISSKNIDLKEEELDKKINIENKVDFKQQNRNFNTLDTTSKAK